MVGSIVLHIQSRVVGDNGVKTKRSWLQQHFLPKLVQSYIWLYQNQTSLHWLLTTNTQEGLPLYDYCVLLLTTLRYIDLEGIANTVLEYLQYRHIMHYKAQPWNQTPQFRISQRRHVCQRLHYANMQIMFQTCLPDTQTMTQTFPNVYVLRGSQNVLTGRYMDISTHVWRQI